MAAMEPDELHGESQMTWKTRFLGLGILTGLIALGWAAQTAPVPQAPQTARPVPPTRDPHTPGYVDAKELPDGTVPPAETDGNFIIGPTYPRQRRWRPWN
jgi:hypothetical protein